MNKLTYTICLLILSIFTLQAQEEISFPKKDKGELNKMRSNKDVDLNGLWESQITQLNWMGQPEFEGVKGKWHVEIEHKGNQVKGLLVCRAKFANNKGYLSYEKSFEGTWDGDVLQYRDVKVDNYINTHRDMRHLETCLKSANLEFYKHGGKMHLEGNWKGLGHVSEVPCTPGKIHLTKIMDEELVLEEAQTFNVAFAQKNRGPVEIEWTDDNQIKKIKNRKVDKGKTLKVESLKLSITVYDHQKDDGDIVSLNYNGNWILEKHEIKNEEHEVDVFLDSNKAVPNYLILYAHNLGENPPNTVAVIVDDGITRQRFVLNADMNTSDVIYFEYAGKKKK